MTKVLVTGANGLLGSTIVQQLLEKDDYHIVALVRPTGDLSLLKNCINSVQVDYTSIFDIKGLEELIKDVDFIIHCAALVDFNAGKLDELRKTNVEGTANLVNIALDSNLKKFVHISSVATLSKTEDGSFYDEKSKWVHSAFNSDYAISKYLSEQEVWRGINEGLSATILNPSLILGSGNFKKTSLQMVKKVFQTQGFHPPGGNGFVDVEDVAALAIKALDSEFNSRRYIVSAENLSYKEFFTKILFHPKSPFKGKIRQLPDILLFLLLNITKLSEKIFKRSFLISHQAVKNMGSFPKYDNSLSKNDFNFEYKSIDTTIQNMVNSYLNSR